MQTKCTAPARDTATALPRLYHKEVAEGGLAHLARGHGELGMPAARVDEAIDLHVVGRVEERGVDRRALADDAAQEGRVPAVATADAVRAEAPDISRPGSRRPWHGRHHLVIGIGAAIEDDVDFARREAGEAQIDFQIRRGELAEFGFEQLDVPASVQRDLVVGEPERALPRLVETSERDRRHLGKADPPRRERPAVAGDDRRGLVDQDRIGKTKGPDRGDDLIELPLRMGAGVARIRAEVSDLAIDHGKAFLGRTVIWHGLPSCHYRGT